MEKRTIGYMDLQRRMAKRASLYFNRLLHRRRYDGGLKLNYVKKELDIEVSM